MTFSDVHWLDLDVLFFRIGISLGKPPSGLIWFVAPGRSGHRYDGGAPFHWLVRVLPWEGGQSVS